MNYKDYTNRFPSTKTVQVKLEPQGKTAETIEAQEMHQFDDNIYDHIQNVQPVLDAYLLAIVDNALNIPDLPFAELNQLYDNLAQARKQGNDTKSIQNDIDDAIEALKESIMHLCADKLPDSIASPKKHNFSRLLSSVLLTDILPTFIKNTTNPAFDVASASASISVLSSAASSVLPNYKSRQTAMETWIPNREIENFDIYRKNMPKIQKILDNADDFPEIHDFLEANQEFTSFVNADAFNLCLTQKGIEGYNTLLGGLIDSDGIVEKGINLIINEINSKNRQDNGYTGVFLPILDMLNKMPLAPEEKQFKIIVIDNDTDAQNMINWSIKEASRLRELINAMVGSHSDDNLYVSGKVLHSISHIIFGDHNHIPDIIAQNYIDALANQFIGKKMTEKIQRMIDQASLTVRDEVYLLSDIAALAGCDIMPRIYSRLIELHNNLCQKETKLSFNRIKGNRPAEIALQQYYAQLKEYKDTAAILRFTDSEIEGIDVLFYNDYNARIKDLTSTVKAGTRIEKYIVRKPKDIAKARPTYLGSISRMQNQWWQYDKKFDKGTFTILQKDGKYYYFVLTEGTKPFTPSAPDDGEDAYIMRSQIKPGKGISMLLPLFVFSKKSVNINATNFFINNPTATSLTVTKNFSSPLTITRDQYDAYVNESYKNDPVAAQKYMQLLYDYVTKADAYKSYDFSKIPPLNTFSNTMDLCAEIDKYSINIRDIAISADQINGLVEDGKALLFLITSRCMYNKAKKNDDYANIIVEALSERNKHEKMVFLNSRPTIMYRPAILDAATQPKHAKGSWLINARDTNGDPIPPDIKEELYRWKNNMNPSNTSGLSDEAKAYLAAGTVKFKQATKDIVKDRRYTVEQYTLNISYIINKQAPAKTPVGTGRDKLNKRLDAETEGNHLSITRTAQNLLYYAVYDPNGNCLEEKSLNDIDNEKYLKKIKSIGKARSEEKKTWKNEMTVADIKDGYCRRAITELVKVAMKYNVTHIFCEALNDNFKDKYSCIDNQMFKGFEKKLVARLSNLHFKDIDHYAKGGLLNPIQLTDNCGNNYRDGIVHFVNNSYIHTMDPDTGFYPLFDTQNINTLIQKKQFFSKFNSIKASPEEIVLSFDYTRFSVKNPTAKTEWEVRIKGDCSIWDYEKKCFAVTDNMAKVIYDLLPSPERDNELVPVIDKMPGKAIEALFKYLFIALKSQFRLPDKEIYRSPVTNITYERASVVTKLQNKKYEVMTAKPKDPATLWLDTMQA